MSSIIQSVMIMKQMLQPVSIIKIAMKFKINIIFPFLTSIFSLNANAQTDFLKKYEFDAIQADVIYLIEKNSLLGNSKIQYWDSGKIIKYENTISIDSGNHILTFGNNVCIVDSKTLKENNSTLLNPSLIELVLDAFTVNDTVYTFYKYKDLTIKRNVFSSVRFESITPNKSITGFIYFYKKIPIKITAKEVKFGEITISESMKAIELYVNHIYIPLK